MTTEKKIIIVGAGFGGVACALALSRYKLTNTRIILINNKPHFEYKASLYRVVTGRSPLEVCIPLSDIFSDTQVEIVEDTITTFDASEKIVEGSSGSKYSYHLLVFALGSQTTFFDIPGMEKGSLGFFTANEAIKLRRHLHEIFGENGPVRRNKTTTPLNIIIVGAGASGVESAGELASYTKHIAKTHRFDPSLITIDLIEACPTILPSMSKHFSKKIIKRLQNLKVNIFTNRVIIKRDINEVFLKDMEIKTKTLIWTAGVKPNDFFSKHFEFTHDKHGRVCVDEQLRAEGLKNIFVIGDNAATPYAGTAQTADRDGKFVAHVIASMARKCTLPLYQPKKPIYAIPVGKLWAGVKIGKLEIFGFAGWILRRSADLKYFLSILPLKKAIIAWMSGAKLSESCSICSEEKM